MSRRCLAVRSAVVGFVLSAGLLLFPHIAQAQGGGIQPLCVSGCLPYQVQVTPDGDTSTIWLQQTSGHTVNRPGLSGGSVH